MWKYIISFKVAYNGCLVFDVKRICIRAGVVPEPITLGELYYYDKENYIFDEDMEITESEELKLLEKAHKVNSFLSSVGLD